MSRMQRPTNDDPIVRREHFIDIEAGILKRASNLPMIALGALDALALGLMTVIDIIVGNDLIQDLLVVFVISIVKTPNHAEIRF